jgi:hypothetical protein
LPDSPTLIVIARTPQLRIVRPNEASWLSQPKFDAKDRPPLQLLIGCRVANGGMVRNASRHRFNLPLG